jgi:hypothetical protein
MRLICRFDFLMCSLSWRANTKNLYHYCESVDQLLLTNYQILHSQVMRQTYAKVKRMSMHIITIMRTITNYVLQQNKKVIICIMQASRATQKVIVTISLCREKTLIESERSYDSTLRIFTYRDQCRGDVVRRISIGDLYVIFVKVLLMSLVVYTSEIRAKCRRYFSEQSSHSSHGCASSLRYAENLKQRVSIAAICALL